MSDKLPYLTVKEKRKIRTLTRRAEYLRKVTTEAPESQRGTSYDRAELAALEFAIETINEHYDVAA